MEPTKTNPIINQPESDSAEHCSFDSQCALKPKDRLQIAGMAALAIAIVSVVMYGFYWVAMKYFVRP